MTAAYLIGSNNNYNLYIQVGSSPQTAVWTNVGLFNGFVDTSNFVTLDTEQVITGEKIFDGPINSSSEAWFNDVYVDGYLYTSTGLDCSGVECYIGAGELGTFGVWGNGEWFDNGDEENWEEYGYDLTTEYQSGQVKVIANYVDYPGKEDGDEVYTLKLPLKSGTFATTGDVKKYYRHNIQAQNSFQSGVLYTIHVEFISSDPTPISTEDDFDEYLYQAALVGYINISEIDGDNIITDRDFPCTVYQQIIPSILVKTYDGTLKYYDVPWLGALAGWENIDDTVTEL